MSSTNESASIETGSASTEVHDGSFPPSPGHQPVNEPIPDNKGPFPATVEDCPEEDGVALGTPKGRSSPPTSTSPMTLDVPGERTETQDHGTSKSPKTAPTQDHSLPAFIQLNGPSQQSPSQHTPPQQGRSPPEAFQYLDADSPAVTPESIQRSINYFDNGDRGPQPTSPSAQSHSTAPSSHHSDVFSQTGRTSNSEHSWSPEASTATQETFANGSGYQARKPRPGFPQQGPGWNGSPELAFGNHQQTPYSNHAVPIMPSPYFGPGPQGSTPLPYQKPPLTGYQHLSQKLTGALFGFPNITPIYRRFEALNHRLLLQLQDELAVLEEELEALDIADTKSRAHAMGFLPASRRAEGMGQGDLGWKKQDILGHIGWRLGQYNKIISSFKETQYLTRPSHQEVEDYRGLLARGQIIAEPETRFLNETNDLVSLSFNDYNESVQGGQQPNNGVAAGDSTPTPQSSAVMKLPVLNKVNPPEEDLKPRPTSPIYLAYAMILAVLIPTLTFLVVPGFLERMVIVALVFVGIAGAVLQSGLLTGYGDDRGIVDCIVCIGLYGGLMSVVASTFL